MKEFLIENSKLIASGIVAAFTVMATLITPFLSNKKGKKVSNAVNQIVKKLPFYIQIAEKIAGFSGQDKLAYVLDQVEGMIKQYNLNMESKDFVKDIENLIEMSKKVNTKPQGGVTYK